MRTSEGITPAREVLAWLIGAVGAVAALLAGLGVLVGGCFDGCAGGVLAGQIALAVGAVALVAAVGVAGVIAARQSWPRAGLWLIGVLLLARLAEFTLTRL